MAFARFAPARPAGRKLVMSSAAYPLSGPRVPPAQGAATHLVVFCHGYGADGNDLIALAPHWQKLMPGAAFVAPNGSGALRRRPRLSVVSDLAPRSA